MQSTLLPRLGAVVAAAFIVSSASVAFAAGAHFKMPPSRDALVESSYAVQSNIPGATDAWCDSLAYPYCADPAPGTPGSSPAPFLAPIPRHPLFGG